jgi:hypothetical protein
MPVNPAQSQSRRRGCGRAHQPGRAAKWLQDHREPARHPGSALQRVWRRLRQRMDLHLTHRGETVAVEVLADRFRFYAPTVGDRWNATSVYWLTFDGGGARMNAATTSGRWQPWRGRRSSAASGAATSNMSPSIRASTPTIGTTLRLTVLGTATEGFPSASLPLSALLTRRCRRIHLHDQPHRRRPDSTLRVQADVKGYKVRADLLDSGGGVLASTVNEWNPAPYSNGMCRNQDDWALSLDDRRQACRAQVDAAGKRCGWLQHQHPRSTRWSGSARSR